MKIKDRELQLIQSARLKMARIESGLKQIELMNKLVGFPGAPTHKSRMSEYESGRKYPSYSFLVSVAATLDYPIGFFYALNDGEAADLLEAHRNGALKPIAQSISDSAILRAKLRIIAMEIEKAKKELHIAKANLSSATKAIDDVVSRYAYLFDVEEG